MGIQSVRPLSEKGVSGVKNLNGQGRKESVGEVPQG